MAYLTGMNQKGIIRCNVTLIIHSPGSVDTSDYNSGGTISVNGFTVTVPKNLIAQFPAAWVPFPKLVAAGLSGYEVSIAGNIVG